MITETRQAPAINIEAPTINHDDCIAITDSIVSIFKAGEETHMEAETIRTAIEVLSSTLQMNTSIHSCCF